MQPTEEQSLELYGYWRSSASWRVRISLCLKNIPFKNIPVNLVKGQQKDESYTEIINPNSLVPTLCIKNHNDTIYISQSPAILEYLEECPQYSILLPKLLPLDPVERAQVRALCMLIGCDIHPIQNLRVLNRVAPDASTPEGAEKRKEWAAHWINTGFIAFEKMLKKTSGLYCFKDSVSLADLYLVPQVYNANRFGVDMTAFPLISGICARLEVLDAFVAAHPSKQPDAIV